MEKFSLKLPGRGTFTVDDSKDSEYPGIVVEFIPEYRPENAVSDPCVVFEWPQDEKNPVIKLWTDPMQEDPTHSITLDITECPISYLGKEIKKCNYGWQVDDPQIFESVDKAMDYIRKARTELNDYKVTFLWGFNNQLTTLVVSASSEEEAVEEAFNAAGSGFENRLIRVEQN